MSSRRHRNIPLGGRYRQVSLYLNLKITLNVYWKPGNITQWNEFNVQKESFPSVKYICSFRLQISAISMRDLPFGLTHWGQATHICVGKLTIIGSDNGLSPGRRQAIIWTIAGILLIGPVGTNFSDILIGFKTCFSRNCIWKRRLQLGVYLVSASTS